MGSILNAHYCQALLPRFKGISPAPEIGGAASLLILTNRALSNTVFGIMSEKITNSILNGGAGGIRTLDTLLTYTHFPGERLRPLGHRSAAPGRFVRSTERESGAIQFALERAP